MFGHRLFQSFARGTGLGASMRIGLSIAAGALLSAAQLESAWAANDKRWDIDNNGIEDFVFQISDKGRVRWARMSDSGGVVESSEELGGMANRYRIIMGAGDFNNNGNKELLVYDLEANRIEIWPISATNMASQTHYYAASTSYTTLNIQGLQAPVLRAPVKYGDLDQGTADNLDDVSVRPYDIPAIGDFNGDGYDDFILQKRSDSTLTYHLIQGVSGNDKAFTKLNTGSLNNISCSPCELVGTGKLDNNAADDLIFRNTSTGAAYYVLTQPSAGSIHITKQGILANVSLPYPSHTVVGVRDIDGDGYADLVAHVDNPNLSKPVRFWTLGPPPSQGSAPIVTKSGSWSTNYPVDTWRILGLRDTNGDSRADLLVHHRKTAIVSTIRTGIIDNNNEIPLGSTVPYLAVSGTSRFPGPLRYGDEYSAATEQNMIPNPFPVPGFESTYGGGDHSTNLPGTSVYYASGQIKRTFYVYPECDGSTGNTAPCVGHPSIRSFDHVTNKWSGVHRIANQPFTVPDGSYLRDAHVYPQLVIDNAGYLHVFHSGHVHPLKHYKSPVPANGTWDQLKQAWTDVGLPRSNGSAISFADKATYVMPAKANNGVIYIFWRQSYIFEIPGAAVANRYDHDPCQLHTYNIYEPWYYTFSTNNGATWAESTMILNPLAKAPPADPYNDQSGSHDANGNGWDSYYANFRYMPAINEFYMTFSLSQYHNCAHQRTSFMRLVPDSSTHILKAYTISGVDIGNRIDENEETAANQSIFHIQGGTLNGHTFTGREVQWQKPGTGAGIGVVTGHDNAGNAHIFYHDYDRFSMPSIYHTYQDSSNTWAAPMRLFPAPQGYRDHRIFAVTFDPSDATKYSIYLTSNELRNMETNYHSIQKWNFTSLTAANPSTTNAIMAVKNSPKRFYDISQVTNADMTLGSRHEVSFWQGTYMSMAKVVSDGKVFGWGAGQFWSDHE